MSCDLTTRPTENFPQAYLGEHRLYTEGQQGPVVPRSEVRRRQEQRASGLQNAERLIERGVGIDQMLDNFTHDHDVGRPGGQRQTWLLEPSPDQGESVSASLPQGIGRPVNPDELMTRVELCGHRGSQPVATADVDDQSRTRRSLQHGRKCSRLPAGPIGPRGEGDSWILVELAEPSIAHIDCGAGGSVSCHDRAAAVALARDRRASRSSVSSTTSAKPSTADDQCNRSARSRAAMPIAPARFRSNASDAQADANSPSFLTKRPVSPLTTESRKPRTLNP